MNSQMERHRGHDEIDPHNAGLRSGVQHGQGDEQHEHGKKSVLKKVKAKAKKIKDSITGHGHDHDHDHQDHEDDDDDDEMEEDADVHGAPVYDTTEARPCLTGQGGASIQQDVMTGGGRRTSTAAPMVADLHGHGAYSAAANPSFGAAAPEIGDYRIFAPEQVGVLKTHDGLKFGGGQTHQAAAAPATGHTIGHAGVRQHGIPTHHGHTAGVQTGLGSRPAEPVARFAGYGGVHDGGLGTGAHQHGILTHQGHIQDQPTKTQTDLGFKPATHSVGYGGLTHQGHIQDRPTQTQTGLGVKPVVGCGGVHDSSSGAGVQQHGVLTHQGHIQEQPGFSAGAQTQTGLGAKPAAHSTGHTGLGARQTESTGHSVGYGGMHGSVLGKGDQKGRISTQEGPILDRPIDLEADPRAPVGDGVPENYQSKVTDPTGMGGEEIGVTHILHSLDRMTHHDQPDRRRNKEEEGWTYTGARSHDRFRPEPESEKAGSFGQRSEFHYGSEAQRQRGPSYTEKAAQAKDVMASKLGYGGDDQKGTSSVTEKVAQAKDVVASKLGYGGDDQKSVSSVAEKAAQAKDAMDSKLGYGGDEQKSASSLAEKAAQAKDVVASKLGYGGDDQKSTSSSVTDYGKKVGSTVQATLAPVYDKVAGAGEAVMSKLQGSGSPDTPRPAREGSLGFDDDKGVSVKEYVTEKLSPREEDKALSEVISGALTSRDDGEKKAEPKGRVTFSAKVERQLGISEQDEPELDPTEDGGGSSPGKAMVDRLKGAMTSWWGKGGENEPSAVAFYDTPKEGFSETKPQEQGKPRLQ